MAGKRFVDLDYNGNRPVNLADPVFPQDGATKHYVDTSIFGAGLVSSVFGRAGAVVAQPNDYNVSQISGLQAALDSKQDSDPDLTAIAGLATTTFGRGSLAMADAAAFRTYIGAGTSSFDGTFGALTGKPTTLSGYGITDAQPLDVQLTSLAGLSYATNSLKIVRVNAGETAFELAPGPGVTSITGTSPIVVSPTSGAAVASLDVSVDHAFTTGQTITVLDAGTNTVVDPLKVTHNSSGAALSGFGVGVLFRGKSDTTNDRIMGEVGSVWKTPTDTSRSSATFIKAATNAGVTSSTPFYVFPTGGITTGDFNDPGAGVVMASGGFKVNNTTATAGTILQAVSGVFTATSYALPSSPGASGNVLTSNGTNWISSVPSGGGIFNPAVDNLFTAAQTITINAFADTPTAGFELKNTTPVANNGDLSQISPFLKFSGQGRKTQATAASQPVDFRVYAVPVQAVTAPTGYLQWQAIINNGSPVSLVRQYSTGGFNVGGSTDPGAGTINANVGFKVGGLGTANTILKGDGTKFAPSTETYPVPGTTGNVMTSDGTNWTSVAPSGSSFNPAADNLFTADQTITTNGIADTPAYGLELKNTAAAAAGGPQQYSPALRFTGQGWKTQTTPTPAGSQPVDFRAFVVPTQGTVAPAGYLQWQAIINNGTPVPLTRLYTSGGLNSGGLTDPGAGVINANTGLKVGGLGTLNTVLKGDGTTFVPSTETYPAPGTTGNVMTSDGTNWTSAAPPAGGGTFDPTVDNAFTAAQTITLNDASSSLVSVPLSIRHNTSGTPANGLGTGLAFFGESDTSINRQIGQINSVFSDVTDGNRAAYLDFIVLNNAVLGSAMRLHSSGGMSVNNTTDPGTGIVAANVGYKIGSSASTSGKILKSDGSKFTASTETYAAPGTSGNQLTSDGTNWISAARSIRSPGFTAGGGGTIVSPGKISGYFTIPYAGSIVGWDLMIDVASTTTVRVWKVATGSASPTVSNNINTSGVGLTGTGTAVHSTTVSDFTSTTVAQYDIFAFEITANTAATDISFNLEIRPTS
jgi:hypothetical protein